MKYLIVIFSLLCTQPLFSQQVRTQALSDEIQTIQLYIAGNPNRKPVIELNSQEKIYIGFDRLGDNSFNRLRYKIIHCNPEWEISRGISEIDYLNGFNDNYIDDYATSVNTTVEYTHFDLEIPNRDIELKLSGNYAVLIYEDGYPEEYLLSACFSVVESKVNIGVQVSTDTDIDSNKSHQQLSLSIIQNAINIRDPFNDIKLYVRQNNRLDNERKIDRPSQISGSKISYEHNRDLIFEAGNEYRRFETASYRYNGLRIGHIEYRRPFYYMHITNDRIRANRSYSYDQDQNGRFYIRNAESNNDSDIYSDYFQTVFTLSTDKEIAGEVYLNGDFTNNTFNSNFRMLYDPINREYKQTVLLKQGLYNYQYLTYAAGNFKTASIEGNYSETENEYTIFVYYRPQGQRYDGLIGFSTALSRSK